MTSQSNSQNSSSYEKTLSALKKIGLGDEGDAWKVRYEAVAAEASVDILVIGEFNHGKSSLINMLVGADVLRVGLTPTTQVETRIRFGAGQERVTLYEMGGGKRNVALNELKENDSQGLARIEVELASDRFDAATRFVDTPGLNEAHAMRESLIQQLMEGASLVLFVLDATQPATRQEMVLIEEMTSRLQPHQCVAVVNKCDRLDEDEMEEVSAYIESTLEPAFSAEDIFYTSAKKRAYPGNEVLFEKIREVVRARKDMVTEEAQVRLKKELYSRTSFMLWFARACSMIGASSLRCLCRDLMHPRDDVRVEMRIDSMNRGCSELMRTSTTDLEAFERAFQSAVVREIDKASIDDVENYLDGFVASEYRSWLQAERTRLAGETCALILDVLDGIMIFDALNRQTMFQQLENSVRYYYVDHLISGELSAKVRSQHEDDFFFERLPLPGVHKYRVENARKQAAEQIRAWAERVGAAVNKDLVVLKVMLSKLCVLENGAITAQLLNVAQAILNAGVNVPDVDELEAGVNREWGLYKNI